MACWKKADIDFVPCDKVFCDAKAVRQISNGYVAKVAAVPAAAPEQNATAVGLDPIVEKMSDAKCAGF